MYDYDYRNYSAKRKRSTHKRVSLFLIVLIVGAVVLWFLFAGKRNHVQASQSQSVVSRLVGFVEKITEKKETLQDIVTKELQGAQGTYAVVIENDTRNERYAVNENAVYDSASLYKLWIMAATYQSIEAGKLKESDPLPADVSQLNKTFHIASDAAELHDGSLDFTVGSALQQMITISHNYAALALTEKIKLSTVKAFLAKEGLTQSSVGGDQEGPTTTASDIALFFKKLSNGELANKEDTQKMLTFLKKQQLNNKLPRYLPEDVVIAHKTGELGMMTHDAGIVYTSKGEYRIVILSKSTYPPGAQERISSLSQAVYEYFMKQQ